MKDKNIPEPFGESKESPIQFPRKEEICSRLDEFYKSSDVGRDVVPSTMF